MFACSIPISTPAPTVRITATRKTLVAATSQSTKIPSGRQATVTEVLVNVREEPNGAVIGALHTGDEVTILNCAGSWCRIDKPSGYVWRGCLSDNPERLGCKAK